MPAHRGRSASGEGSTTAVYRGAVRVVQWLDEPPPEAGRHLQLVQVRPAARLAEQTGSFRPGADGGEAT